MIYIGMDDTDNKDSRGTGFLARTVAAELTDRYKTWGVTRHQLLVDPRIPYTSHNSSNAIHLLEDGNVDLVALADAVQSIMLAHFNEGSDPGLCIVKTVTPEVMAFGQRAKKEIVTQADARAIAECHGCILRGLGGTQGGVIGSLAAVGLAASGEDGRFVLVGRSRELDGVQNVQAIVDCGIAEVRTTEGQVLKDGLVQTIGKLRPALRNHQPILFVTRQEGDQPGWVSVKLD
ncbi:MAG: ABC transporter substrate-binding protein [Chloroflexi bacterium]|nr:ABC transporter substrate-binding protein [Chloroflexota bacterium]